MDIADSNEYELNFATYNGPAMMDHLSKRLIIGYVSHQKPINNNNNDKKNSLVFKEFRNSVIILLENEFQLLRKSNTEMANDLVKKVLNETKYFLTAKLGLVYFHGKYLNMNRSYTVNNIQKIIQGFPIANVPKEAVLKHYFNYNKSIENVEKFEKNIFNRGYRIFKETRQYYLQLLNKQTKEITILNLDENFKIIDIIQESEKLCVIDILRNRLKSLYTIAGTFLDIFDLRYQLTKTKEIKKEQYKDILFPSNALPRCFELSGTKLNECLDNLILRIPDGNILLNPHLVHKLMCLKEISSKIYKLNVQNLSDDKLASNFYIHIEDIIEYKICHHKNNPNTIFKKEVIADSIIDCKFDINKWLIDNFESNSNPESNIKVEDLIEDVTNYIFQETFALSDKAHQCVNSISKLDSEQGWPNGTLPRVKTAASNKTERSSFLNTTKKQVTQENMNMVKRILFARTHLDVFGLNINTNFFDGVSDRDIKREYYKMMNIFLENVKIEKYNIKTKEDLDLIPFNGTGMVKTAYKKLNEAYFTLKDPLQRDMYINELTKNKKF